MSSTGLFRKVSSIFGGGKSKVSAKAGAARRMADAARDEHQWQDAIRGYRDYLAERTKDGPLWVQLGHALKENGQLHDARIAYEKALAINPQDADASLYYGILLKKQGHMQDAARAFAVSFCIDGNSDARREKEQLVAQIRHDAEVANVAPPPAAPAAPVLTVPSLFQVNPIGLDPAARSALMRLRARADVVAPERIV